MLEKVQIDLLILARSKEVDFLTTYFKQIIKLIIVLISTIVEVVLILVNVGGVNNFLS